MISPQFSIPSQSATSIRELAAASKTFTNPRRVFFS
jgi:hypothetical protein